MFSGKKILSVILLGCFLFLPNFSLAQEKWEGFVPCGAPDNPCNICFFLVGIKNLLDWGLKILVIVGILAIFVSGVMYIVSMGDSGMMETAKRFMYSALLGVIFFLGAWLVVNTVFWVLGAQEQFGIVTEKGGSWHEIRCDTSND